MDSCPSASKGALCTAHGIIGINAVITHATVAGARRTAAAATYTTKRLCSEVDAPDEIIGRTAVAVAGHEEVMGRCTREPQPGAPKGYPFGRL